MKVENSLNAAIGDMVEIEVSDTAFLKATFVIYMIPVFGLFLGAGLGQYFAPVFSFDASTWTPILSITFLFLSFIIVKIMGNYLGKKTLYQPRMRRIVTKCPADS